MNKLLTILCLVLLSVHSYSQEVVTGPFLIRDDVTYHQDTNQLVTGIVESFHTNGQLKLRTNFIDGEREGFFEEFHYNGQLRLRGNYDDGKLDGLFEEFHEDGQLAQRGNYIDGEFDGLWETFHDNVTDMKCFIQ